MQLKLELGHDTEVAATTPQSPEQIVVLVGSGPQPAPVGGDHLSRDEVVRGQTEQRRQPAHPATQRETAHAGVADDSGRYRQAMCLGGSVQSAQGGTATDPSTARHWIDIDVV